MEVMRILRHWFAPAIDAFFAPSLPFTYRWRLLALQPIVLLTYSLKSLPWLFSNAFEVIWISTRRRYQPLRAIVFHPPYRASSGGPLRPIHLDIHGGVFMGGIPEYDADFCQRLSLETGGAVISTQYRYSPRHIFPAAHEDIEDVSKWLVQHAEKRWGANPKLLTVSGFSAGANLALAVSQMGGGMFKWPSQTAVKGCVTFYAPVDFRLKPTEKPKPANYPKQDPLFFLQPLFDSYVAPTRPASVVNPILNPIIAPSLDLPPKILLVTPTIDILLDEQLKFAERLKEEVHKEAKDGVNAIQREVQIMIFEDCIHAWLELPSFAIDEKTREKAFKAAVEFIKGVHRGHGWYN